MKGASSGCTLGNDSKVWQLCFFLSLPSQSRAWKVLQGNCLFQHQQFFLQVIYIFPCKTSSLPSVWTKDSHAQEEGGIWYIHTELVCCGGTFWPSATKWEGAVYNIHYTHIIQDNSLLCECFFAIIFYIYFFEECLFKNKQTNKKSF